MRYWLMKSEPSDVSIDDLAVMPNQTVDWYGAVSYTHLDVYKRQALCKG